MTPLRRIAEARRQNIPNPPENPLDWAVKFARLPGSAKSERFDPSITPWTSAPLRCGGDHFTRVCTFVKPVQCGGSVVGEILLLYWLDIGGGDVAYYWPNDEKAQDRWKRRISRIVKACQPLQNRFPHDGLRITKAGLVQLNHLNLAVIGAFSQGNVESDSYRRELNEEVHDNCNNHGWLPGRLAQAYKRTTAYWDSIIYNISNASEVGDQLHQAFLAGTQQYWEVACPGCRERHAMRTRYDDKKPNLGGLRYDSAGCKRSDGSYDYNRLAGTVRYEFPCGYPVRDTAMQRRSLSLSGDYGEPQNTGAHLTNRSFTLEAVSIDYIPWLDLIQEKHVALKALRYGDIEPWKKYLAERECHFWSDDERPSTGRLVVNTLSRKNRNGLRGHPDFAIRFFALDRQQGELAKGQLPHWWLVIRDFLTNGDSELVYEGKLETDEQVIAVLDEHGCTRIHGAADSGDDTMHVYRFCLRYGINAIKGGKDAFYSHGDEGRKIFSIERPLYQMVNGEPTFENEDEEPQFWFYSKAGIRDRLGFLRGSDTVRHITPGDVSEDYQKHNEAEEQQIKRDGDGHAFSVWIQHAERNDLFVCECYIAMQAEMAGLIGEAVYVQSMADGNDD